MTLVADEVSHVAGEEYGCGPWLLVMNTVYKTNKNVKTPLGMHNQKKQ